MYTFKPLTITDAKLLFRWLHTPHVSAVWSRVPATLEECKEKYTKKLNDQGMFPFIIYREDVPIGYIQMYDAHYYSVVDPWFDFSIEPGTWGMDMFIGEENFLSKGHGGNVIREFTDKIFREKHAKKIIVDPAVTNRRAVDAYQKGGFVPVKEIDSRDGRELLMECFPTAG